ncbi:MAG: ATP-dependent DNA helicase [bacterium]|nr:ATP-dependent DNA helicase [bacterium]
MSLENRVRDAFAPGGPIPKALPGFTARPSQVAMAIAVARAVVTKRTLLAELPTGAGKSLSALVPITLALLAKDCSRAAYSTATITLQEQLISKDIPTIQTAFGGPQAALLKGMGRYLCVLKWTMSFSHLAQIAGAEALKTFNEWAVRTQTGDQNELPEVPPWWSDVAADSRDCLGPACAHQLACSALRARERARSAPLLAVNHHLLLLYLRYNSRFLAEDAPIVLDEAHHVAEIASEIYGTSFTDHTFRALANRLHGLAPDGRDPLHGEIAGALYVHNALMAQLKPSGDEPVSLPAVTAEHLAAYISTIDHLRALICARPWEIFRDKTGSSPNDRAAIAVRMLESYRANVEGALRPPSGVASWVEPARGKEVSLVVCSAPIDVGGALGGVFRPEGPARILMSATLAAGGSFAHVKARLSLPDCDEIVLPSSFDYQAQTRYYLPASPLDPNAPEFTALVTNELRGLLRASQGRALVLFTSYKQLRDVASALRGRLPYRMLVQDEGSTTAIVEEFRRDVHSVLLGTARLWEGVDIQGEALSVLAVVRLPFDVPSHPLARARYEAAKARGEQPFATIVVPDAIIKLRQGVGRLIRSQTDRGVVAILDGRVQTKNYGRSFMRALPPAPVLSSHGEVAAFLLSRQPAGALR